MKRLLLAATAMPMFAFAIHAQSTQTLYVATNGSDSNSGTQAAPFATIAAAASHASSGTTIDVAPGTYAGGFTTSASNVNYVSTTPLGATIVGAGSASAANAAGWENRGNNVTVSGFNINGAGSQATSWAFGFYNAGSNVTFQNGSVENIMTDPSAFKTLTVGNNGGAGIMNDSYYGGTGGNVIGSTVSNIGPSGTRSSLVHGIYQTEPGKVANDTVSNVVGDGISLWHGAQHIDITGNTVTGAGYAGIGVGSGDSGSSATTGDYVTVSGNTATGNTYGIFESGTTGTHNVYTNNTVYGNSGGDIHLQNGLVATGTITSPGQSVGTTTPAVTQNQAPVPPTTKAPSTQAKRQSSSPITKIANASPASASALVATSVLPQASTVAQTTASQQGAVCAQNFGGGTISTQGTQIIGPDGKPLVLHGLNMYWKVAAAMTPDAIAAAFPGANFLRLNFFQDDLSTPPDQVLQFVLALNAKGIMVELEDHDYPTILTGQALSQATTWYSSMASTFKGDPIVVFGSQNEPSAGGSIDDINNEIHAIYNAVRSTGNNSLFLVNPYGGGFQADGTNLAGMTNTLWDLHAYANLANGATDQASLQAALNAEVSRAQSIAAIPVLFGEFGPASGNGMDAGGMTMVDVVTGSGMSYAAWAWQTYNPAPYPGDLVNPPWTGNSLTEFGQKIATAMGEQGPCSTGTTVPPPAISCAMPSDPTVQAAQAALNSAMDLLNGGNGSSGVSRATVAGSGGGGATGGLQSSQAAQAALASAQSSICAAPVLPASSPEAMVTATAPPSVASQPPPQAITTGTLVPPQPTAQNPPPTFQSPVQPGSSPQTVTLQMIEQQLMTIEEELATLVPSAAGTPSASSPPPIPPSPDNVTALAAPPSQPPVDTGPTQASPSNAPSVTSTAPIGGSGTPTVASAPTISPTAMATLPSATLPPDQTSQPASPRRHHRRGRDDVTPDNDADDK